MRTSLLAAVGLVCGLAVGLDSTRTVCAQPKGGRVIRGAPLSDPFGAPAAAAASSDVKPPDGKNEPVV